MIAENQLGPYELAIYRGLDQTKASKAVKAKAISDAVSGVLSSEISFKGQTCTVAEHLVIQIVGRALYNGSSADLKNLAAITGDLGAQKVEIVTSAVDDELARMAIGEDEDE